MALVLGLFLCILVWNAADLRAMLFLWSVRVAVTLLLMLPIENHYTLDGFGYFEANKGPIHWQGRTISGGTAWFVWLLRMHMSILPRYYHLIKVSFAFGGLLAIYIFYRAAVMFTGREDRRLLYVLGLIPGITLWSSMILKDPLVMLGVAIYGYGAVGCIQKRGSLYMVWIAVGMLIASVIRIWMGLIMLAPLGIAFCVAPRRMSVRIMLAVLAAIAMMMFVRPLMKTFAVKSAQELTEQLAKTGNRFEGGGSGTNEILKINTWSGALLFVPWGSFTALFRPFPGEVNNAFGLLAGLEDLVMFGLLMRAAIRFKPRDLANPVILWATALVISWGFLYGFISSHNMGTAVRYRVQIMPIVVMLLLYLGRPRNDLLVAAGSARSVQST